MKPKFFSNPRPIVIASESQDLRGNPFSALMFYLDCHEFATQNKRSEVSLVNSRNAEKLTHNAKSVCNDEFFRVFTNAKDTHPQTPSAKGGGF
ncbi:hypothetical protein [Helicobacter sp. MIT 01-3238]|uniref:hypothetical protein n=1 Tax=Helicobacter sp. MIT 01-3238 TaxID=398627 RepID=UPI000E1F7B08|nr:hypothetical protein [Helicobacter sp. MIT 01-3238]RDU52719.1 hypothetical protein CQA40_06540 [Helicobacter sp. MIT 01-3238]